MGLAEFDNCDLIFQAAAATALTGAYGNWSDVLPGGGDIVDGAYSNQFHV